jgi:hypothetical protein
MNPLQAATPTPDELDPSRDITNPYSTWAVNRKRHHVRIMRDPYSTLSFRIEPGHSDTDSVNNGLGYQNVSFYLKIKMRRKARLLHILTHPVNYEEIVPLILRDSVTSATTSPRMVSPAL